MKFYNANPLDKRTGDCVYRALSFFLGITWIKAVFELVIYATNRGMVNFNYVSNITGYLADKNFVRKKPKKNTTVNLFIQQYAKTGKCYLLAIERPKHLTIIDSEKELVDTWNCSDKFVKYYWER